MNEIEIFDRGNLRCPNCFESINVMLPHEKVKRLIKDHGESNFLCPSCEKEFDIEIHLAKKFLRFKRKIDRIELKKRS